MLAEGWSAKAKAGYLQMHRSTVHRVFRRWVEDGVEELEDRPHGRPPGVRRVDLKAPRLEGYAPRRPRGPLTLQQTLFPYAEASSRVVGDPPSGRTPGGTTPHSSVVAAVSARTWANNSGRESIGWCPVGSSTTLPALLAYSRWASGGVARSSAHTM